MQNKIVSLEKTIVGHRSYKELEFRQPKFGEWADLGEPFMWVATGADSYRRIDDSKVIAEYARRLMVERNDDGKEVAGNNLVLEQLGIVDTRAVRSAVLSFFPDSGVTETSVTSGENSSSTPASTPEPSTA